MLGSGSFHEYLLNGDWAEVRCYLVEELEQLHAAVSTRLGTAFNTDGTVNPEIIPSHSRTPTFYISNEGPKGALKWAKVNLLNGVKNRLPFANLKAASTGSILIGRRSGSPGDFEEISLEPEDLQMVATELNFSDRAKAAVALQLHASCGGL